MTRKTIKQLEPMLDNLVATFGGEYQTGLFLALMCDLLQSFVKDVDCREMRLIEIKLNDFFSIKYDFEKETIVE